MTVRELIQKLMEVENIDAEVTAYIDGTLGQLKDRIKDCEEDDDSYVLDDFCEIESVEEELHSYPKKHSEVHLALKGDWN